MNFWKAFRIVASVAFALVMGWSLWTADTPSTAGCSSTGTGVRCMPVIR